MRHGASWIALLVLAVLPAVAEPPAGEIVRGVTVSTHRGGQEWGSDSIGPTFAEIRAIGANWVAIHPYARIGSDGSVDFRAIDRLEPPEYLRRPIEEAHALGLKILIKPHLAYWGSPFGWRGEITFDSDEAWQRFWTQYEEWIVSVAAASSRADGFVVGTELDKTLEYDGVWRRIIARVRQQTDAPLTYAANWTDYERVGFWDALDAIGIQAYFPLTDSEQPTEEQVRNGWERQMLQLRDFAERHNRNIVFTELGYNRSFQAAHRPWEYRTDGLEAEPLQLLCMRIALTAIENEPRVVGAFLWKWFPQPRPVGRNFQLATPAMKETILRVW